MDDTYNRRKKAEFDKIFHALNNYHENIKLTIAISTSKFLDAQLIAVERKYITKNHRKKSKIHIRW